MCVSHLVMSNSLQPHGLLPARHLCPWGSPGKNTGVNCHSLLRRIFPTQKSNPGLLHRRQICYHLSYRLLLLSRFSHVRLCATPWTAAHQAPPSLGFSRQEHWMGCHFLLQCMKVKSESGVARSCPTLSDPVDCSLPGFSVRGIFQARVLEWGAIAFSLSYREV